MQVRAEASQPVGVLHILGELAAAAVEVTGLTPANLRGTSAVHPVGGDPLGGLGFGDPAWAVHVFWQQLVPNEGLRVLGKLLVRGGHRDFGLIFVLFAVRILVRPCPQCDERILECWDRHQGCCSELRVLKDGDILVITLAHDRVGGVHADATEHAVCDLADSLVRLRAVVKDAVPLDEAIVPPHPVDTADDHSAVVGTDVLVDPAKRQRQVSGGEGVVSEHATVTGGLVLWSQDAMAGDLEVAFVLLKLFDGSLQLFVHLFILRFSRSGDSFAFRLIKDERELDHLALAEDSDAVVDHTLRVGLREIAGGVVVTDSDVGGPVRELLGLSQLIHEPLVTLGQFPHGGAEAAIQEVDVGAVLPKVSFAGDAVECRRVGVPGAGEVLHQFLQSLHVRALIAQIEQGGVGVVPAGNVADRIIRSWQKDDDLRGSVVL